MQIEIPYNWQARDYQKPLWNALNKEGYKRAMYVWHRRAGKDLFGLNHLIRSAIFNIPGTYWHVFPKYKQGRKSIWQETTLEGRKYLDYIPKKLISRQNNQEMTIEFINGSIYQIVGSDNIDDLRGPGIKGVIFSELSEQNPAAWPTIRPMIMAADAWALFNLTPKGQNHAYFLAEMAKHSKEWFYQELTVGIDLTDKYPTLNKPSETNTGQEVFSRKNLIETIQEDLAQGKTLDFINQEYYCSFHNAIEGSYYTKQIKRAEEEGRITNVAYETTIRVNTWWDLGIGDSMVIWFTQSVGNEIRVIDYYENNGEGLEHYIKYLDSKLYLYGTHNAPHDISVRELGTGKSRLEAAELLGIRLEVVPKMPVTDGINAVRAIFNRCYFDKEKCHKGLMALRNYRKEFDERKTKFKDKPLHDWASHGADGFRYFAVGYREKIGLANSKSQDYAIYNNNL